MKKHDFEKLYKLDISEIEKKFKFLGEGISRKVYAVDDRYVIKVAKNSDGLHQNRVEYYVYTHTNSNFKKYLCPIIWFTPRMLVMYRAEPLTKLTLKPFVDLRCIRKENSTQEDLKYLTNKFKLLYEDIRATSSWGKLKGQNVLIDYGCPTRKGDIIYTFKFLIKKNIG